MTIYEAGSVTEAVAYAEELRCEGRYDWFRGQRQNWPLKTTFARLAKSEQRVVEEKFSRFVGWLSVTPGLEWLSDNVDGAFAVAQHYGMPTQYLDFTTDPRVAGFFASGEGSGKACILCLNTSDLRKFWQAMPKRYPPPEFIGIDVSNLWRLQAQRGVFLSVLIRNSRKRFMPRIGSRFRREDKSSRRRRKRSIPEKARSRFCSISTL